LELCQCDRLPKAVNSDRLNDILIVVVVHSRMEKAGPNYRSLKIRNGVQIYRLQFLFELQSTKLLIRRLRSDEAQPANTTNASKIIATFIMSSCFSLTLFKTRPSNARKKGRQRVTQRLFGDSWPLYEFTGPFRTIVQSAHTLLPDLELDILRQRINTEL
jgi:hypothetical protein